jgi:hypothetical protein
MVPGSSLSYGGNYSDAQQAWNQQPVQNQASFRNQSLSDRNTDRDNKLHSEDNGTDDSAVAPVRSQIYKLLTELIDKPDTQHHIDN